MIAEQAEQIFEWKKKHEMLKEKLGWDGDVETMNLNVSLKMFKIRD